MVAFFNCKVFPCSWSGDWNFCVDILNIKRLISTLNCGYFSIQGSMLDPALKSWNTRQKTNSSPVPKQLSWWWILNMLSYYLPEATVTILYFCCDSWKCYGLSRALSNKHSYIFQEKTFLYFRNRSLFTAKFETFWVSQVRREIAA